MGSLMNEVGNTYIQSKKVWRNAVDDSQMKPYEQNYVPLYLFSQQILQILKRIFC